MKRGQGLARDRRETQQKPAMQRGGGEKGELSATPEARIWTAEGRQ